MYYRYFIRRQSKRINYFFWFFFFYFGQEIILAAEKDDCLEQYSGVQLNGPGKPERSEDRLRELKTWMYLYAYGTEWESSNIFYAVRAFEKNKSIYELKKKLAISDMKLDKDIPYFFHFKKEDNSFHKQKLTNFKNILNALRSDKSTFEFFVCKIEFKNGQKYVKKIEDSKIVNESFYLHNFGSFQDRDKGWFSPPEFWSIDRRDIFEERDYSELEKEEKKDSGIKAESLKESNEENKLEGFSEGDAQRAKLRRYVFYLTLLAIAYKLGTIHIHTSIKEFLQRKMHPSPSL